MKTIANALTLWAIVFSLSAKADTANREQLVRFAKAVGIYEQLDEQKVVIQTQGLQAAQQYAQQIAASAPGLPEQFKKDMEDEMKVFMSNTSSLIDTDFAVDAYINLISKKLSASETQALTEFYESELGKKFTRANTEVMGEWSQSIMSDFEKKMMIHLQSFTSNLIAKTSRYSANQ